MFLVEIKIQKYHHVDGHLYGMALHLVKTLGLISHIAQQKFFFQRAASNPGGGSFSQQLSHVFWYSRRFDTKTQQFSEPLPLVIQGRSKRFEGHEIKARLFESLAKWTLSKSHSWKIAQLLLAFYIVSWMKEQGIDVSSNHINWVQVSLCVNEMGLYTCRYRCVRVL